MSERSEMTVEPTKNTALNWDGQFYKIPSALMSDSRLTSRHIHVYLALITDARQINKKIVARPTLGRIADKTGLAEATISRTTKDLVKWGWLMRRQTENNGVNEYTLLVSEAADDFARLVQNRNISDADYKKIKAARDAKTEEYNKKTGKKIVDRATREEAKIEEFSRQIDEGPFDFLPHSEERSGYIKIENAEQVGDSMTECEEMQSEAIAKPGGFEVSTLTPLGELQPVKMKKFKSFTEVSEALMCYLETGRKSAAITDKDLERYGLDWGMRPD
ncbi:MarR family transcriptional regulator [Burkholderia cepacia]|uniref:MarR family transcriptional regulator n=1 Tax=Burkholderia cepacia TaxID=292 RepID=UPI000AE5F431|nr:helix-turn-helix domain-containing protein [Burkholderia cepacia]